MHSAPSTSRAEILRPEDTPITMSSREIAELTGKRHDHVVRDVRRMLSKLAASDARKTAHIDAPNFGAIGDALNFEAIYVDERGREKPCFNLPKRECLILVSGYSTELRARIIDRWLELEAAIVRPQIVDGGSNLALVDFADRARADIEAVRDLIAREGHGTRGALIKTVKELAGNPIGALKAYLDDRFMASRERDKMVIGSLAALDRSVGQVLNLARRALEPDAFVASDWVAVNGVYALAGIVAPVPRQKSLSARLTTSLVAFCIETNRQMDMRGINFTGKVHLYRATAVRAWLKDRGKALIDQHIARHSAQTVIQFPGNPVEGGTK